MWRSHANTDVVKANTPSSAATPSAANVPPDSCRGANATHNPSVHDAAVPAPSTASDATSVVSGSGPATDASTCSTSGPAHNRYSRAGTPTIIAVASASGDSGVVRS